jgi:hypothetical protein
MTTPITTSQTTQQLALNNELFVKQLENALKDAHLPPNTLREMIINVNKSLVCDNKCQEKKTIDQLKNNWAKEKNTVNQSENNLETLRAKYFQAAKGDDYYKTNILIPEFQAKINKQVNNYKQELAKIKSTNSAISDAYSNSDIALKRIKELYKITLKKNKSLNDKLDHKKKFVNTGERKLEYELDNIKQIYNYNNLLNIIYLVFVVIFAITQIIYKNVLKDYIFWIKLIGIISLPWILSSTFMQFVTTRFLSLPDIPETISEELPDLNEFAFVTEVPDLGINSDNLVTL